MMADVLPGNHVPAVYPFQSMVVNLNAITEAHRDKMDSQICLVLPIGDFEGGEICMMETGLVIRLKPGDFVVFRSSEITHFNLHYRGKALFYPNPTPFLLDCIGQRASLVLNTDKCMKSWAEDCNGWIDNVNFQYRQPSES
jgi:hypothetical protein